MGVIEPYDPSVLADTCPRGYEVRFTRKERRKMRLLASLEAVLRKHKLRARYGDYSYEFRKGLFVLEVAVDETSNGYVVYQQLDQEVLKTKDLDKITNFIQRWLKQLRL